MANDLQANASWYVVSKPGAVLAPDGSTQYQVVGLHVDLQAASTQAATIPGAAITLNVVLFVNPATVTPATPRPVAPAAS